jgi:hypothetical protein
MDQVEVVGRKGESAIQVIDLYGDTLANCSKDSAPVPSAETSQYGIFRAHNPVWGVVVGVPLCTSHPNAGGRVRNQITYLKP